MLTLLDHVGFDPSVDRLFAVGDLIDRGEQSAALLDLLAQPWFFSVRGNHEDMLLILAAGPDNKEAWDWWIANGGAWAAALSRDELARYAAIAAELPLVITVVAGAERFNVLHAEFFGNDYVLDAGEYGAAAAGVAVGPRHDRGRRGQPVRRRPVDDLRRPLGRAPADPPGRAQPRHRLTMGEHASCHCYIGVAHADDEGD